MSITRWLAINGLVTSFLLSSAVAWAVNEQALWLPSSYIRLMPELREVARKLEEETQRCQQVVRGSLHDSSESVDEAIFFFICRDAEQRTFSVLADANTLEFLQPVDPPPEPEPDPQEVQRALMAERARRINSRMDEIWQECQSLFAEKTGYMRQLQLLTDGQPMPRLQDNRIRFTIDFDAENPRGEPLQYSADCQSTFVDPVAEAEAEASAKAAAESNADESTDVEAAPESAVESAAENATERSPSLSGAEAEPDDEAHPAEPPPPAPVEFRIRPRAFAPNP